jgi:hypothetical protein
MCDCCFANQERYNGASERGALGKDGPGTLKEDAVVGREGIPLLLLPAASYVFDEEEVSLASQFESAFTLVLSASDRAACELDQ